MITFNRSKFCSVDETEDGLLIARGTFIDSVHEICLTLQVNKESMLIVSATVDMVRIPHPYCSEAKTQEINLVGVKIGPGARKAVQNAVGHSHGCTHLADLTIDVVKALVTTNYRIHQRGKSSEEIIAESLPELGGTCHTWTRQQEEWGKEKLSVAK